MGAPTAKRPFQSTPLQSIQPIPLQIVRPPPRYSICNYCHRPDHSRRNCRRANGLCLACGSSNHSLGEYLYKRTGNNTSALSAFLTLPVRRNSGPAIREALLPSQQLALSQAQKGDNSYSRPPKGSSIQFNHRRDRSFKRSNNS